MSILFDVLILLVIILCSRKGARRGVSATIVSILVFIIAMTGAGYLSKAYSDYMVQPMTPFLSGIMESEGAGAVQDELGLRENGVSVNDMVEQKPAYIYDYSSACMEKLGISEITADKFSEKAAQLYVNGSEVSDSVNTCFCETVAYFIGVIIAFTLIIIFLSVIVELTHLRPKLKLDDDSDEYFGAVAGFIKGVVLCIGLCWVLSFLGIVIGRETVANSVIGRFLLSLNWLSSIAVA